MEATNTAAVLPLPQSGRSLVRKLAEVMAEVSHVPKTGRNEFHRYDYATEADIVAAVRKGLAQRRVMLLPNVTKMTVGEVARKNGSPDRLVTLEVVFTVADGDSGETMTVTAIGEGQDAGDKASYKAMTGATKYALLKLFLIPTGDDPEQDDPRDTQQKQGRSTQKQSSGQHAPAEGAKSEKPKPDAKQQAAADLHRARASRIWGTAQRAGFAKETFADLVKRVLGSQKASTDWTDEDMEALENALPGGEASHAAR